METVGEILLTEREKRGLTVKDVEAATSIRALYISAIESNKFSVVPGEVYLKGFIRNYANYLGLNGQAMVDLYRQQQLPPTNTAVEAAQQDTEGNANTPENNNGSVTKWLIIGTVALILAGGAWWFTSGREANPAQPIPGNPAPNTAPMQPQAQVPIQPQVPVQTPATPTQQPPKTKPVVVAAKFTAECWAQITVDGKEVFEGIMEAGVLKTWEAEQTIVVKLGNAGAAELSYNGQPVGKLGGIGEVVVKKFAR